MLNVTNATLAAHGGGHDFIIHDLEMLCIIWAGVFGCNLVAHYTGLTNM